MCIQDEAGQTFFSGNTMVEPLQDFTYDSLYRLVKAMGRERESLSVTGEPQLGVALIPSFGEGSRLRRQYSLCFHSKNTTGSAPTCLPAR